MKISVTYPNWAFLILSIIFLFITLLTAIGNALVFAALFRFRKLRTTSNLLIGNLALSDLLLAITVLPISATTDATGIWLFGPVMCDIWLTIDVFYCTASVWSLVTIAFDRFTATTFPIWYRGNKNRRRVICYILFVWILSGLICLPGLLGWGSKQFDRTQSNASTISIPYSTPTIQHNLNGLKSNQSTFSSTNTHIYNPVLNHYECVLFTEAYYIVYSAMGSFIIPFIIMIILYAKIFFILQQRTRLIRQSRRIHNKSLLECMIIHEKPLNEQSIDKNLLTIPNTSTSLISSMTTTKPILTNIKIAVDAPSSNSIIHEKYMINNNNNHKTNGMIQHSFYSSMYGSPSESSTYSYSYYYCSTCTCSCTCCPCGHECHCFHLTTTTTTTPPLSTTTTTNNDKNTNTDSTAEWNSRHMHNLNDLIKIKNTTVVNKLNNKIDPRFVVNEMSSSDQIIQQKTSKFILNSIMNNNCSITSSTESQSSKSSSIAGSFTSSSLSRQSSFQINRQNIKLEKLPFQNKLKEKMMPMSKKFIGMNSLSSSSPLPPASLPQSFSPHHCHNYLSVDRQKLYPTSPLVGLDITNELDNLVNRKDNNNNNDNSNCNDVDEKVNNSEKPKHSNGTNHLDSEVNHVITKASNVDHDAVTSHMHSHQKTEDIIHSRDLYNSIPFITTTEPINIITSTCINTDNIDSIIMKNTGIIHTDKYKPNILKKFSLFHRTQKHHDQNNEKGTSIFHQSSDQLFPTDRLQTTSSIDLEHQQQPKGQQLEIISCDKQHEEDTKIVAMTNVSIISDITPPSMEQLQLPDRQQQYYVNRSKQSNQSDQVMERAEQRERRATKRMGLIIIIFALSWIPFTLMYLVRGLCGEQFCPDISDLRKFVTWLGYVNSTINPILYALFNVHFRQAFIYFLKCTHINSHERHHQQQQQDHEKSILMKLPPPPPPPLSQQQQ
uniref:Putative 5-hydroxytryptamine receptor n=1 Tax=Schistosoma mansoni TaxID=6183 RepID=A0A3Q0KMD8_SCHMA